MSGIILNDNIREVPDQTLKTPGFKSVGLTDRLHLGYQYEKDGHIYGDKRCDYCGKWFTWTTERKSRYMEDFNWKVEEGQPKRIMIGNKPDGTPILRKVYTSHNEEPIHCGSGHCNDYHARVLQHEKNVAEENDKHFMNVYKNVKQAGVL